MSSRSTFNIEDYEQYLMYNVFRSETSFEDEWIYTCKSN